MSKQNARQYPDWMLKYTVAESMRKYALRGTFTGAEHELSGQYFSKCVGDHVATGTRMIFTRDTGMHTSGWWKNPDYERCFHLSLSFRDPVTGDVIDQQRTLAKEWAQAFYGNDIDKLWIEPPCSEDGIRCDVWHYRLFCDEAWQPIIPRGEVYSKEFTEAGWKSWSDVHAAGVPK